jgi:hypothetical protein
LKPVQVGGSGLRSGLEHRERADYAPRSEVSVQDRGYVEPSADEGYGALENVLKKALEMGFADIGEPAL